MQRVGGHARSCKALVVEKRAIPTPSGWRRKSDNHREDRSHIQLDLRLVDFALDELERTRVGTVPFARFREPFTFEDMPEVTCAACTCDFDARRAIVLLVGFDRPVVTFVEGLQAWRGPGAHMSHASHVHGYVQGHRCV